MFFDISDVFSKTVDAALTKIGIRVVSDKTLLMMQIFMTFAKGQGHSDLLKMMNNTKMSFFQTLIPLEAPNLACLCLISKLLKACIARELSPKVKVTAIFLAVK